MKTTMLRAIVALTLLAGLMDVEASAQYRHASPAAAVAAQASPPDGSGASMAEAQSQTAPAPSDGTNRSPSGNAPTPVNDSLLMDNGLWDGAAVGPSCSICGGGSAAPPDWYTTQGVRVISHSAPRRIPIAFESGTRGNFAAVQSDPAGDFVVLNFPGQTTDAAEVFSTKQFQPDAAAGYNMTIGHYFLRDRNNNDHFVEFTFWGLNSWTDSKSFTGLLVPVYDESAVYTSQQADLINAGVITPATTGQFVGSLRTPFPALLGQLPGATPAQRTLSLAFNGGLQYDISYRSTMNNYEINGRFRPRGEPDQLVLHPDGKWRRQCQPGTYMSYLYGLRFMQVDEGFRFHSRSQSLDENLNVFNATGDYDAVTHNNLVGLQIGADMTFRKCRWEWGIESKVGPFVNFADQMTTIDGVIDNMPQSFVNQNITAAKYQVAFVGEVGFQASYKFTPNMIGRAAYDFMWVTGIALAPEQVALVSQPDTRINLNGSIYSHGISLGVEWLW